ncbi:hypothetical protein ACQU0X_26650 [Pseudovibrio ascidiaceicola]|uniref:hypothetical protein n=1 Tax=Pseudovibrio ascidiaceicola TaxID=285279 RepID=UPI003D36803C
MNSTPNHNQHGTSEPHKTECRQPNNVVVQAAPHHNRASYWRGVLHTTCAFAFLAGSGLIYHLYQEVADLQSELGGDQNGVSTNSMPISEPAVQLHEPISIEPTVKRAVITHEPIQPIEQLVSASQNEEAETPAPVVAPQPVAAKPAVPAPGTPRPNLQASGGPIPEGINQELVATMAQNLISQGLTHEEGTSMLEALDRIRNQETLSQEDLENLSPKLRELLVNLTPETPDAQSPLENRIISMPPHVRDEHRGKSGVPTIPESNSWAALGGNVQIPFPGGGDIDSPEMFKYFGLEP